MKKYIRKISIMLLLSLITNISFSQTTPDPYYDVQSNENGDPLYFKHQIIIAFSPELLKKSVIDNKEFVNGNLSDFFTSEAITLAQSIGIWNSNIAVAPTSKIYRSLDSDDTLSLTRNGETITIPKYWATLLVFWPLSDETPILKICDSLKTFYPIIEFAHPNYLYKLNSIPNDVHYQSDQFNLHPNTNWTINGNIEIENAWSIETGSPDIKLGIYDAPIIYTHEDFGGGTLASSKIKGGRVYYDGLSLTSPTDISAFSIGSTYSNHGTNVAGIAAAIRNNEIGIAGVAGGDYTNGNVGTSLYTFGIFGDNNQTKSSSAKASDARISEAIIDGANYILQPNGSYTGYGLDIQNHSWGREILTDNVRRAIKGAARNKCVAVCSRGNDNDAANQNGTTTNNYPSTYNDEWVISVGASGTNKKRLNITASNVGRVPFTQYPSGTTPLGWSSMYGKGMDVLAPGAQSLLITTHNDNVPAYDYYCQVNKYCYFNGTSAAAPHVSGLAALLLSKYRPINGFYDRLEPEDVENLIEKYAMHHAPAPSFYSAEQGWGLINPDNTLDKIRDNRYKIHHFTNGGTKTQTGLGNMNITIPASGAFGLGAGNYTVYRWKIEENYTLTFGTNEQILGYWPRLNSTFGLNDFGALVVTEDDYAKYDFTLSGSTLNVKATTYAYYHLPLNKWLYLHKDNVATAFSVHTFDPTASAVNETVFKKTDLKLYPNPASNYVNIDLNGLKMNNFQVFDLNGKQQIVPISVNAKGLEINTANLVQGFYICKTILSNGSVAINKILITK